MSALLQRGPVIVSEVKLDYSRLFRINRSVVELVLGAADLDAASRVGLLERLLPGMSSAADCACACACSCSCSCS